MNEIISNNIKQLIKNQGITQSKFCENIGVTRDTFYQQMRANSLTTNTLERYAKALGVPVWRLLLNDDEKRQFAAILDNTESHISPAPCDSVAFLPCPVCGNVVKVELKAK